MKSAVLITVLAATSTAPAQWWPGTYQLTNDSVSDIHPSAGRDWLLASRTILVWQTNRNGTWDIYSRIDTSINTWTPEIPVTIPGTNNINPVTDGLAWCVWERVESDQLSTIWGARLVNQNHWDDSVRIGVSRHAAGRSAELSIIAADLTRVVWLDDDSLDHALYTSAWDGASWSVPAALVSDSVELHHPRIGRGGPPEGNYYALIAWEKSGRIYHCQPGGSPIEIADSSAMDMNPEVVSESPVPPAGPWLLWQSTRDGDTAIFIAAVESLQTVHRVCQSPPAGVNTGPIGVPAAWLSLDFEPRMTVWVTSRRGNPDICNSYAEDGFDGLIDSNPALDSSPALTMEPALMWCFWQSNRSGNWDIYGSFIYETGIGEQRPQPPRWELEISPNPCRGNVRFQLRAYGTGRHGSLPLQVFDQSGRLVRTLTLPSRPSPLVPSTVTWDGTDNSGRPVAEGCYFCELRAGGQTVRQKLLLTR